MATEENIKDALRKIHEAATLLYKENESDAAGLLDNLEQILVDRYREKN